MAGCNSALSMESIHRRSSSRPHGNRSLPLCWRRGAKLISRRISWWICWQGRRRAARKARACTKRLRGECAPCSTTSGWFRSIRSSASTTAWAKWPTEHAIGDSLLPLAGALREFELPRPIFTAGERETWSPMVYVSRHAELQVRTDLTKVIKEPGHRRSSKRRAPGWRPSCATRWWD